MLTECGAVYSKNPLRKLMNSQILWGPVALQAPVFILLLKGVLLAFGLIISSLFNQREKWQTMIQGFV